MRFERATPSFGGSPSSIPNILGYAAFRSPREYLRRAIKAKRGYFGGWSHNVRAQLRRASIVIRFEDLIADPIGCIERIRPLIDLPEPALDRLPSFEDLRSRGYTYGNGRHLPLTAEQRAQWRKHGDAM